MKIEFLPDGSPDCPLLRIFDFMPSEAKKLKGIFYSLANGSIDYFALQQQRFITSIDGCVLRFRVGERDHGLRLVGPNTFDCVLTKEGWENVAGLVEPFCEERDDDSYQWLNDDGDISLLLSPTGRW